MLTLVGLAVVVVGFALRLNPLMVVAAAALATAMAGGLDPLAAVSAFGRAFNQNRYVSVVWIILPVIGLLERYGLQLRARALIGRLRGASAGRLLTLYLLVRQAAAALGLNALGGHAQMVRPLVAPMAEAAAQAGGRDVGEPMRQRIRANAAAAENVGAFFIAFGSILLIRSTLHADGLDVSALRLSLWAIPTAVLAFLFQAVRLAGLDRRIARERAPSPTDKDPAT
jgi:uncharacterized membrane protein